LALLTVNEAAGEISAAVSESTIDTTQ